MATSQSSMSRQEFMRMLEAPFKEKTRIMRLPFLHTSMDSACVSQAEQIWQLIQGAAHGAAEAPVLQQAAV